MTDYTIAIYCFMDDYLKMSQPNPDTRRKVSDAEMLTVAVLSAQHFYGNQHTAYQYMQQHHSTAKLDKANFNRHLHGLSEVLMSIFTALGQTLKQLNTESRYLMVRLLVEGKSNSKPQDSAAMRFLKKYYRKRIETTFSEITAHFPAKIHAVSPQGFLLKIILFIFAFTFNKSLSAT